MLPGKDCNVTDISKATVAILGFMGVTTLTSNTRMTKRPEKLQKPIMAATISGCPGPTGLLKNMVFSYFSKWQALPVKGLLEEILCQSVPVSWQLSPSVAHCQLYSPLWCWISGFLTLYHRAFLLISKLCSPFPMPPHRLLLGKYKSSVEWYPQLSAVTLAASIALWRWSTKGEWAPSHQSCSRFLIIHPNGHKTDASRSSQQILRLNPASPSSNKLLPPSLYSHSMCP